MNIFITGANRGLGLALVKECLSNDHHVFAGVRNVKDAKQLRELKASYPETLEVLTVDVKDEWSVTNAVSHLRHGLDVIINNAGILLGRDQDLENVDIKMCLESFDVNTLGPLRVIKHAFALLSEGAIIINISSEAASMSNSYAGDYSYGLSKASLNMLSEKVQVAGKEKGIAVYSVHPGWLKTDMGGENAHYEADESARGIYQRMEELRANGLKEDHHVFIDFKGNKLDF